MRNYDSFWYTQKQKQKKSPTTFLNTEVHELEKSLSDPSRYNPGSLSLKLHIKNNPLQF